MTQVCRQLIIEIADSQSTGMILRLSMESYRNSLVASKASLDGEVSHHDIIGLYF